MKKKPIVYLAGFECFLPNGKELAKEAVSCCKELGFEPISAVLGTEDDPTIDTTNKLQAAKQIFKNCINHINECDIFIANLNNFRGWEPDSGTCFALGYAYTQGKKLYAYMDDTRPCYEKYIGSIHYDGSFWRDDLGAFFESGACNLMMSGPAKVIEGTIKDTLLVIKEDLEKEEA